MKLKRRKIWKVIEEFPDYAVSNYGDVKRIKKDFCDREMRVLKPVIARDYKQVYLYKNKVRCWRKVHHLVLETFVELRPKEKQTNHKDGNKLNNYCGNLEWVTQSENTKHAYATGLINVPFGEKVHNAKLKNTEVWLIKRLLKNKIEGRTIAKMFKVHEVTICKIKLGRTWGTIN